MLDKSIHSFLQALSSLLSLEFMQLRLILVLVQELVEALATELVKVLVYRVVLVLQDLMTQTMRRLAVVESKQLAHMQRQNPRIRNLKLN